MNNSDDLNNIRDNILNIIKLARNIDDDDKNMMEEFEYLDCFTQSEKNEKICNYALTIVKKNYNVDPNGIVFFEIFKYLRKSKNDDQIFKFYIDDTCNIFKVMVNKPICATFTNFENAYQGFKSYMIFKRRKSDNIINEINNFSKLAVDIHFSKKDCKKLLDKYNYINPDFNDAQYLFPLISHIHVDYNGNIIEPIRNLEKLLQSILKLKEQKNDYYYDLFCYYGICYIWKILNITDGYKIEDSSLILKQRLEIGIFFKQEIIQNEIEVVDSDAIYLKTKKISIDKVIELINYLLTSQDQIKFFHYYNSTKKNNFFIMISNIWYHMLCICKLKDYKILMKSYLSMYDISKLAFKNDKNEFLGNSFLIQVLIDFYKKILDSLTRDTQVMKEFNNFSLINFKKFIITGPPFFSFQNSRDNKLEFLKAKNNANGTINGYLYSGFPSLISNSSFSNQINPLQLNISKIIQYDDPKSNDNFKHDAKTESVYSFFQRKKENNVNFDQAINKEIDPKKLIEDFFKPSTKNQDEIDLKIKYFVEVAPFFLFLEAEEGVPPRKNDKEFHKLFRVLLAQKEGELHEISKNICNRLSDKFIIGYPYELQNKGIITNNQDSQSSTNDNNISNTKANTTISKNNDDYTKTSDHKLFKRLKNLFRWYLLQFFIEIKEKKEDPNKKDLIKKDDSVIELHVEESNYKCKKLFVKFLIKSIPKEERDQKLNSLIHYTGSDKLLKGIENDVKKYCEKFHLMYSEIALINQNDVDEKLEKLLSYLKDSLSKINEKNHPIYKLDDMSAEKNRAIKILEMAVRQIKYKTDESGKKSGILNQMCKKIFNTFFDIFRPNDDKKDKKDDFILQLFISFAYESVDIIQTRSALKKITKILQNLNSKQKKDVIVSLFNFFEGKRAQRELIHEITKNDQIFIAKQNAIERNSGHLYRFNKNICFECEEKINSNLNAGIVQFFSCGHIFHIFNCTGIRNNIFYQKCPICPKKNKLTKSYGKKSAINKNAIQVFQNPSFEYYFNSKENRFHSYVESIPELFDSMKFPTCIADPPISIKVNYNEVESFFGTNDDIVINFEESEP